MTLVTIALATVLYYIILNMNLALCYLGYRHGAVLPRLPSSHQHDPLATMILAPRVLGTQHSGEPV